MNSACLAQHPAVAYLYLVRPMARPLVALLAALFVLGCSRTPLTEPQARQYAQRTFSRICHGHHISSSDYEGPVPTTVGGAAFAYEWHRKGNTQQGVLVSITSDGGDEVAFLGRGP